jgi:Carboxypeptidase regulatory-like domain
MRETSLPVFIALMLWTALASSQTGSKFRVTGVVINASNGAPIPDCHLTPSQTGRNRFGGRQFGGQATGADTDQSGHFTLTLPSAGAWRLVATAPSYTTEAYEEHDGYSSAVVVTDQAPTYDLTFKLLPEASLTGTVLDEANEAVRNAQVRLFTVPPPSPDGTPVPMSGRGVTMTDDRGFYEFDNLPAGNYRVSVDARPWYAASAQQARTDTTASSPDPSLDVTYAETWYPGVDDVTQAETVALRAGDTTQADLHLLPLPSIHLHLVVPETATTQQGRPNIQVPMVERVGVSAGGFIPVSVTNAGAGQMDVSGLSPGTYQVMLPNDGHGSKVALIQVSENGVHTVDFNQPSDFANLTVRVDGSGEDDHSVQVGLVDAATRTPVIQGGMGMGFGDGPPRGRQRNDSQQDRVLQVPPGTYEVVLNGRPDVYLTGVSAKSAEVTGHFIKVHGGDATITVHVAHGRAAVNGIATFSGKPDVGATVLLVPAGMGDPSSITALVRDQANTDGSFELPEAIPGEYILVAIDHGWQVNWKDPSTLSRYLIHGVPLNLRPGGTVKQAIEATAP